MLKVLSQSPAAFLKQSSQIKIAEISFEEFHSISECIRNGRLLLLYSGTDSPGMLCFFPAGIFRPEGAAESDDADEMEELDLMRRSLGNFPLVFGLQEDGEWKKTHFIPRKYTDQMHAHLLWLASEKRIFTIRAGSALFYICIAPDRVKFIEAHLNSDPAYLDAVRDQILSDKLQAKGPEGEADEIIVTKPLEFLLGSCFLPRQSAVGKKTVSSLITGMSCGDLPADDIARNLLWFRFWIESEGKKYSAYYTVDVKGETQRYRQFFEKLFKDLVRYAALFLKKEAGIDKAGGGIVSPPEGKITGDLLHLESIINFETRQIGCGIIVPEVFISEYLLQLLPETERNYLSSSGVLTKALAVNSELFGRNIDTFYRQSNYVDNGSESSTLSVSEIFSILGIEDRKRLMQNFFLANGWSHDKIQSLFMYKYYAGEDVKPKIARDVLFNKNKYAPLFPNARQNDWIECKGVADSYEQLKLLNREALEGIHNALQQDKLILPYKASYMLYNEFQKPLDESFKRQIEVLLLNDDTAELLREVPRNRGQQAISSIPNEKLALALLPGKPEVKSVHPFMSRTKRQELEEEIGIVRQKYENGEIGAERVYNEMKEFRELIEELAVPEEEMVE